MQERLLQFIWQFQYFNKKDLTTVQDEIVNIIHPGYLNTHAGPDFLNGKIEIGGILWSGNVEIHLKSSDWEAHHHHLDDAYENVTLHVVWEHDKEIFRRDGSVIPAIELKHRTLPSLLRKFNELINNPDQLPCGVRLKGVNDIAILSMVERALMQRLENKTAWIHQILTTENGDWEEITYQALARNMGFKVNAESFIQLAKSLPYKIIAKHVDQPYQIEALLFGQAGFLENPIDEYAILLKKEYKFLSHKYGLSEHKMSRFQWKYLRMRPGNFPTIRIAQLAALLYRHQNLFSLFRDFFDKQQLEKKLAVVQSDYWQKHYDFGKPAKRTHNGISKNGVENIMINTGAALLVAYGKSIDQPEYIDKGISLLSEIPAEENHIITMWKGLGIKVKSAFDSQGLIELYNGFCSKKRCINCNIGMQLLQA